MAALSVATVIGLAAQFAPNVAPDTIVTFAANESGLYPYAINDNTAKQSYCPRNCPATEAEAIAIATALVKLGRSVDMGLMQVNSQHLGQTLPSIRAAFTPGQSVRVAATIIREGYVACGGRPDLPVQQMEVVLRCTASRYNSGKNGPVGQAYAARLWRVAEVMVPSIVGVMKKQPDFFESAHGRPDKDTEERPMRNLLREGADEPKVEENPGLFQRP